jgi:hypothetical protein
VTSADTNHDIIETEAEELDDVTVTHLTDPAPATTLALRADSTALFPINPDEVIASMHAYQALLPRLLDESDFQVASRDKDGKERKFVKRSGWRKIARAFNLSVVLVSHRVERDADGTAIRAEAVVRAIAPNGLCQDGDGYCSIDETRFEKAHGRKKLENDLRATATTRAKSRAISDLVGMGDVSAEELDAPGVAEASPELRITTETAIAYLLDGDLTATEPVIKTLEKQYGGRLPAVALQAICLVAKGVKDARESTVK